MSQNHSPRSTTKSFEARATVSTLVAWGPHDDNLKGKADNLHYEIRRVTKEARNKTALYEIDIFRDDDLVDKHVVRGMKYADAVCHGIELFVKAVDGN